MTPKEIVLRAIEFKNPPRLPVIYCNRDFEHSDVLSAGMSSPAGFKPSEPGMTEWGYAWETLDHTMGQPKSHPLTDWTKWDSYKFPDPHAPGRIDHLPKWLKEHPNTFNRFSIGFTGFNQATFLRGFENFLLDLVEHRAQSGKLLDQIYDFENAVIRRVADMPFDCVAFADDWGTQQTLMISPKTWSVVFKPRYAEQFKLIHKTGKKVWFHSCGNVYPIIKDMIDIGVDVLEFLQPDIFGVEKLSKEFGGKICFCCSVDHQRRAVSGTKDEIFAYTKLLKEKLGSFHGGLIGYIEDYSSLGMTEQNYQWIREAFHAL